MLLLTVVLLAGWGSALARPADEVGQPAPILNPPASFTAPEAPPTPVKPPTVLEAPSATFIAPAAPASPPASVYTPQPPTENEKVLLPGTPAAAIDRPADVTATPAVPIASNRAAVGAYTGNLEPTIWKKPSMLFIGDSITEMGLNPDGWTVRVASAYSRKADVINRGFGGYTTSNILLALPEILESVRNQKVVLAVVWLGANDASLPDRGNAVAHVPLEQYMRNLMNIVQQLQQAGVLNIILVTPPPVWELAPNATLPGETLPHRTYRYTAFYAAAVRAVAAQMKIPLLDMWEWFDNYQDWQSRLLLPDGLHMNPTGQEVTYNAFMKMIDEQMPEIRAASLPWHHPTWWFIDYKNAVQQFAAEASAYSAAHNTEGTAP